MKKAQGVKKLWVNVMKYIAGQSVTRQKKGSNCWKRVTAEHVFPAIVTRLKPDDAIGGAGIHYEQDRILTIMEARRAQGFLDHEPIIGTPSP